MWNYFWRSKTKIKKNFSSNFSVVIKSFKNYNIILATLLSNFTAHSCKI